MRAFAVRSSAIEACPQRVLLPRHYRTDGSCRCREGTPCQACGKRSGECAWIFQNSPSDAREWCCDACREAGPTAMHRMSTGGPDEP